MSHTKARMDGLSFSSHGAIAQLGERLLCKQEVASSILAGSTSIEFRRTHSDHDIDVERCPRLSV